MDPALLHFRTHGHTGTIRSGPSAPSAPASASAPARAGAGGGRAGGRESPGSYCASESEQLEIGPAVACLPVELDVAIPVRQFRVRNLLALEAGQVIETRWANGEDLPLAAGEVQLAWAEFEVVESQLAVRLTRLI